MADKILVYNFPEFVPITGMKRVKKFIEEFRYVWGIKTCRKDPIGMLRHAFHMSKMEIMFGKPIGYREYNDDNPSA